MHALLERQSLGPDALRIIHNVLTHEGAEPPATTRLVRELLAKPLAAADASAIFRDSVPRALRELAIEPDTAGRAGTFDELLERYLAELEQARAILPRLADDALLGELGEGRLSARALRAAVEAIDRRALELAAGRFLEATSAFVRALRMPGLRLPAGPRRFPSPIGVVSIGGMGDDRHDAEAALIIDPGGDDVYERAPARAGSVSVIIDLSGNDRYGGSDVAVGALSALIDLDGDDRYAMRGAGLGAAIAAVSLLHDARGDDRYAAGVFGLGASAGGLGALVDARGDDLYELRAQGQGYGVAGGLGLLWDRAGNDRYSAAGEPDPWQREGTLSFAQGAGAGLRHALAGGTGILRDEAGDDRYEAQMFAQGLGYYYGVGLLWDGGGRDTYLAVRYGQGSGVHQAVGVLQDEDGSDDYRLAAGVGQGAGIDLAVGMLLDAAGDDRYRARYIAQGTATANGVGLLADPGGADRWKLTDQQLGWGRAEPLRGLPSVGLLANGRPSLSNEGVATLLEPAAERPHCPAIPAEHAAHPLPLVPALRALASDLERRSPDQVAYADVLRRLMDDPGALLEKVPEDDADALHGLGLMLACAAAMPGTAERMASALEDIAARKAESPLLGILAAALRARPLAPATSARLGAALASHRSCALRALALQEWATQIQASKGLSSSCWREQSAALQALRRAGAEAPDAPALPSFLRQRAR